MKAYYIDIWENNHCADIDTGFGNIAYVEEYHFDMLIVAQNRREAWTLFNAYHIIETGCTGNIIPSMFRDTYPRDKYDKSGSGLIFITVDENVTDAGYGRIEKLSGHRLCTVVQYHQSVPYTARYLMGWGEQLWSKEQSPQSETFPLVDVVGDCEDVF